MHHVESKLPDFIIIGAAKSGTTSLWDHLNRHPDIFMSHPKEPCFFDEDVAWSRGIDWYRTLFAKAQEHQVCGEASTNYSRWPQVTGVPRRIHAVLPNVKLIYLMRNPVDRTFSHYLHRWTKEVHRGQPFRQGFGKYCKTDRMCIDSSMYCTQLEQFLPYFPKERILPVVLEQLLVEPDLRLSQVFAFLGVSDYSETAERLPVQNEFIQFRYHVMKNAVRDRLKQSSVAGNCMKLLPPSFKTLVYNKILLKTSKVQAIQRANKPQPLTHSERSDLRQLFEKPNQELADEFGVDISHWD